MNRLLNKKHFMYNQCILGELFMLKRLFTNDYFFLAMVAVTAISTTVYNVLLICLSLSSAFRVLIWLIEVPCIIGLYISYKKQNKNVMKGLIGALLTVILLDATIFLEYESTFSIYAIIYLACAIIVFFNHFVINSTQKSLPAFVKINQIAWLVMFINNTVWDAIYLPTSPSIIYTILLISDMMSPCLVATIICVESKLGFFKAFTQLNDE